MVKEKGDGKRRTSSKTPGEGENEKVESPFVCWTEN